MLSVFSSWTAWAFGGEDEQARKERRFAKKDLIVWHSHFTSVDADGDGMISEDEFRVLVLRMTKELKDPVRTDEWLADAFQEADADNDGKINFKQFVNAQ